MKNNTKTITFREIGGKWLAVDSAQPVPPTLADVLEQLHIVVDENTQFCRIIRNYETYYDIIEYRAYNNAKVTITINVKKYE